VTFLGGRQKKCIACDEKIAESLEDLGRSLVSFIGERGSLRVTKTSTDLREYTGVVIADTEDEDEDFTDEENDYVKQKPVKKKASNKIADKEMRKQLGDCMSMARRIVRSSGGASSLPARKKRKKDSITRADCVEEKKMST